MSNRAWMPLHIGDYLKDTGHLSATEHGAYLLLIMHYWQHGSLPADERITARIAKLSPEQWAESRDLLAMLFQDGWKHKRIDEELAKADEIIEKRRNAALGRHAKSKADANAEQVQSTCTDTHVPPRTTEPSSSLRSDDKPPAKPTPRQQLEAVLSPDLANAVLDHRRKLRKPLTERAAHNLAVSLSKFPDPDAAADRMIEKGWLSIDPDWAGAAQPRGSPQSPGPSKPPSKAEVISTLRDNLRNGQPADRRNSGPDGHHGQLLSLPSRAG